MKLFKKSPRGFTLIELLVVIAIIAILAAIILVSLSSARSKAKDSKVEAELSGLRAQMELYYNSSNFSYGTGSCTSPSTGNPFTDTTANGASRLIVGIQSDIGSGTMDCNATSNAWAVDAQTSNAAVFWCVDSDGQSKSEPMALGAATQCV